MSLSVRIALIVIRAYQLVLAPFAGGPPGAIVANRSGWCPYRL